MILPESVIVNRRLWQLICHRPLAPSCSSADLTEADMTGADTTGAIFEHP